MHRKSASGVVFKPLRRRKTQNGALQSSFSAPRPGSPATILGSFTPYTGRLSFSQSLGRFFRPNPSRVPSKASLCSKKTFKFIEIYLSGNNKQTGIYFA